ncbi:saccharopine dehydrogenase (plasmid) [Sinorhizobium americanum CCGM7]|uniref:saccharopine dehydrogenase family protein n=1 Tax=Sinorhizobium americanum TaxID=194963 RepID=UPI0004D417BF|nr:saccharopine dehydrogenase C-terminal domain-containing protein [Sinorhizobium americanum]APG86903.1 saccharopine dehydrogenase [Sinorhizobium americanum CCGM7]
MKKILVIGAGNIGKAITDLLTADGFYEVTLADVTAASLAGIPPHPRLHAATLDARDPDGLCSALQGKFAVVSAVPYHLTVPIAHAAVAAKVHYLDLTEDVGSTRQIKTLAQAASSALIPQCGLAPGFISIVAHHLTAGFDRVDSVRLRTGALPQYPANALKYNLTWSTDGVINEYCEPCEAIANGRRVEVPALEECEEFSLDGVSYEAFNTSGGLGTLCDSLQGHVQTLNYRSIRYPGHAALMKALLHDLRLGERRELLKEILEYAVPTTLQDVVIIVVIISGLQRGRLTQETYANKVYGQVINGKPMRAIQATTAAGICTALDLLANRRLPQQGLICQEHIALPEFLANRFGAVYTSGSTQHQYPMPASAIPSERQMDGQA